MSLEVNRKMSDVLKELSKQKEQIILDQLSDLVSRGLLVIEETQPTIVRREDHHGDYRFELKQAVKLTLKDKEYIENLEKENKKLRNKIQTLLEGPISE